MICEKDRKWLQTDVAAAAGVTISQLRYAQAVGSIPQPSTRYKHYRRLFYTDEEMRAIVKLFKADYSTMVL